MFTQSRLRDIPEAPELEADTLDGDTLERDVPLRDLPRPASAARDRFVAVAAPAAAEPEVVSLRPRLRRRWLPWLGVAVACTAAGLGVRSLGDDDAGESGQGDQPSPPAASKVAVTGVDISAPPPPTAAAATAPTAGHGASATALRSPVTAPRVRVAAERNVRARRPRVRRHPSKPAVASRVRVRRARRSAATTAPAPKRPEPAKPGYLTVDVRPYATVYIDGRKLGDTPLLRVPLPAGKHRLRAVSADGRVLSRTIQIRSGDTTRRRFTYPE